LRRHAIYENQNFHSHIQSSNLVQLLVADAVDPAAPFA